MNQAMLTQVSVYPIKSCAGIDLSSSWVEMMGLPFDRRFVVSDHQGKFITARTHPTLCLIQVNITATGLVLNAPNMPALLVEYSQCLDQYQNVTVWNDTILAQRCTTNVDQWFSQYLSLPCYLLFFGEMSERHVANTNKPVAFADGFPLLLISQGSLDDLNNRLAKSKNDAVSMKHFRPNIVVDNCEAFAEDTWQHIRIGEVEFELVKPCSRCVFTTVNPETAEKNTSREPLTTLRTYRQVAGGDVMFGQNIIPLNKGQVRVGDKITVLKTQDPIVFSAPLSALEKTVKSPKTTKNKTVKIKRKVDILFDSWDKNVQGNTKETLLEQAENAGLHIPYSCRGGMCGSCKVKLDSGEVKQLANDGLTDAEQQQGYILACSCIPQSDLVISLV